MDLKKETTLLRTELERLTNFVDGIEYDDFLNNIDQYCKWVDEFLNNSYEKELEKIATRFYPEGVFSEEGFNEYQIAQSKILLKKSMRYLIIARAIIEKRSNKGD